MNFRLFVGGLIFKLRLMSGRGDSIICFMFRMPICTLEQVSNDRDVPVLWHATGANLAGIVSQDRTFVSAPVSNCRFSLFRAIGSHLSHFAC